MSGPRRGSDERFRSRGSRRGDSRRGSSCSSSFFLNTWIASCAILLFAGAVQAAEIIDVRVGQHPTFTRVVFELDAAAGYQLSKSVSDGNEELIVTLQATSIPRRVQSPRQSLLGLVRVTPDGRQAIARIELGKKGLIVKERIMSSPYRVVLDVQDPNASLVKPTPAAKPTPKPAPQPAPKPAPKPTAQPAPAPAPKPVPQPAPPPPAPKPAPPPPPPAPKPPPPVADEDLFGADEDVEVIEVEEDDLGPGPGADGRTPPLAPGSATAEPSEGNIATMGEKERMERPPQAVPKAQMADEGGGGMGTLLTFVGVVALLGVGAFAVLKLRGRRRGDDGDDDDGDDDAGNDDDERDGANPFARMAVHEAAAGVGRRARPAASGDDTQLSLDSLVDDMPGEVPAAEPDLAKTTVTARDAGGHDEPFALNQEDDGPTPGAVASPPAAQTAGDDEEIGDEEMAKLIQQFEQRIAALESRLDEQAEARERLERQVAAQTEELRVQRAAIARTQRAVRNLTRGEEDGPTEPALRDPNG